MDVCFVYAIGETFERPLMKVVRWSLGLVLGMEMVCLEHARGVRVDCLNDGGVGTLLTL